MVFEAVKVAEGNSSLSLDDITLVASSCPALGSCDFSKDTCGYTVAASDSILWLVGSGKTHNPNITIGPPEDSTDSHGMYAYMDFTKEGLSRNDEGRLISPPMPATEKTCFSFWTNLFGQQQGNIIVKRVSKINKGLTWLIFMIIIFRWT